MKNRIDHWISQRPGATLLIVLVLIVIVGSIERSGM